MENNSIAKKFLVFLILIFSALVPSLALAIWGLPPAVPGGLPDKDLGEIVTNITNWILGFVAILSVLALIWGGIRYLTAAGDEGAVEDAKNIITQAVIGLIIVGISYSIVVVVVNVWISGKFS